MTTSNGMLFACWAMVILLFLMGVIFMRAQKKEYAIAMAPLILAPLVHIFSGILANWLHTFVPLSPAELRIFIDVTAGLVSCVALGWTSHQFKSKRVRNVFELFCSGFVCILTLVLVVNTMLATG